METPRLWTECVCFYGASITRLLLLGSPPASPKLKLFSLSLYLLQTNHLTSRRCSLLMVSPLCFLRSSLLTTAVSCECTVSSLNNGLGQQMPAFEVDSRLSAMLARYICTFFLHETVGMTDTWPALLRALVWVRSFDNLIWSDPHG